MKEFLFIGGPADGERWVIEHEQPYWSVTVYDEPLEAVLTVVQKKTFP